LKIETAGWVIQQVTPAELVSGNWHVENETLTVPLAATVPNGPGEFELRIRATREHSAAGKLAAAAVRWPRIQAAHTTLNSPLSPLGPGSVLLWKLQEQTSEVGFALPRPVTDADLAALVVISPADNIELTPNVEQLRSLVNDSLPPEVRLSTQQQPLVYREDVGGEPAAFAGQFRVRRQAILVDVETRVRIGDRETEIEQRLMHSISDDPAKQLHYLVPRSLVESSRFELLLDGVATSWTRPPAEEGVAATLVPLTIDLRDSRIGSCQIVFRHRQPRSRPANSEPLELTVPFVQI
jgi:hypothetical protein